MKTLGCSLEPASLPEDDVERDRCQNHEEQRERVTQQPVQLWHVVEVHPVDRPYQRRREEYRCPSRNPLDLFALLHARLGKFVDLLVLREAYQGKVDAEDVLQELAQSRYLFVDALDVVLHVTEV